MFNGDSCLHSRVNTAQGSDQRAIGKRSTEGKFEEYVCRLRDSILRPSLVSKLLDTSFRLNMAFAAVKSDSSVLAMDIVWRFEGFCIESHDAVQNVTGRIERNPEAVNAGKPKGCSRFLG